MLPPPAPLTRADALAWARGQAGDPAAVRPFRHPDFEADPVSGGYAFVDDTRLYIRCQNGGWSVGLLEQGDAPADRIADLLARNRHADRTLTVDELGPWQRAAGAAVRAGTTVAELPPGDRPGLDTEADRDHADWLWIALDRSPADPLRTLARDDSLMGPPRPDRGPRTHPCPLCDRPAAHMDRYPRSVCHRCHDRTVDSTGRRVIGYNTSLGGGFEARFTADDEPCDEVTRTGRCWVDGHPCSIGEARFGGVVVEAG
jgi:hypothetical protein